MTSQTSQTADPDGTIDEVDGGAVIRFERRLSHPIAEVWAAVTEPARLAEWWLPFDADITVDLRPGGLMVMTAAGDEPMTITCEILRVEPPVLLEHTHVDPGARLLWELEAAGDDGEACILRLSNYVPDRAAAIENCYAVGLHQSLERLAPALAGTPIPWDWEGFARHQARYAAAGLAPDPADESPTE
jgi:uncharacterized protein YndB with AHSA1/START domain